jgi:3-keto-5-aminohexanoate cleavage enzyme
MAARYPSGQDAGVPVIIEAAVNGATSKHRHAAVPRTPSEITSDALACLDAGAAIVHQHHDDPNVGGATRHDPEPYAGVYRAVLELRPDALLYPTMAGGDGGRTAVDDRYAHLAALEAAGLLPMAIADPGSFSIAGVRPDGSVASSPYVYENTSADFAWMIEQVRSWRVPCSVTIFEAGHLRLVLAHHRAGSLPPGTVVGLCFGGPAALVGLPPTERSLDAYVALLDGTGLPWTVRVIGGDVVDTGLAAMAVERGGNIRVGLEDWDGEGTRGNVELVAEAVAVVESLGERVATPSEARALLGP